MDQEADHLLSVAGEIAEGAPIAWEEAARRATDERDAQALRGLQDLEAVVSAHRRIKRTYDSATPPADTTIGTDGTEPARWGHLLILNTIGKGSFGTVYRAYDDRLAIDVALKLLSRPHSARSANPTRILEEARLLARVRHPNVVTVYGADQTQDRVGLWMEFVQGRTLAELLRTQGPFGIQDTVSIGRDLCRAAAAVHQAGFLHGDIKAHNVMRQENGRIVLMDFGAGRALTDDPVRGRNNVRGTPLYLAPEVLEGGPQSTSSDIYALGVLLYHLVTGSYPVLGESQADLADSHKRGDRRRLDDARADLPDDFVRVVERATAVDPARRFASAESFEDALASVRSPLPAERQGAFQRAKVFVGPVPRWVMALAAAAVLVAGGAMVVWPDSPAVATPPLATSPGTERPATPAGAPAAAATYEINAAFYRAGPNGDQLLQPGSQVAPGDELFLKLEASVPLNVYVVNEDEKGEAYLLFPLPGQRLTNPLPARESVSLPGGVRWRVTSAGGREHFVVFASPDRLDSFEQAFAALPSPRENAPVVTARLQATTIERLRGVGGLAPDASRQKAGAGLSRLFTTPLTNARESARGLWVRQITLDNPAR